MTQAAFLNGYDHGYLQGRKEAAEAVRAIAADWPPHHTDFIVKTALHRAAIAAEGTIRAEPAS